MEKGLTKNKILSELSRSPHGKLTEYVAVGREAAKTEAEFFAHLIAWNHQKGAIRDSKVALPIVSLAEPTYPAELAENSLAHLALLGPRELDRAVRFMFEQKLPSRKRKQILDVVKQYLREREADQGAWDRTAVQHRDTLKSLYSLSKTAPSARAQSVLFKREYPAGSVFEDVANLKNMTPAEAAAVIVTRKIPFLIAMGALGKKAQEPDLVLAMIERMSATELVTSAKMLEKLGIKTNPVLRGAFEKALEKASKSKQNMLKTTRAAEAIEDETLKAKLQGVQERQIQSMGVEGNWLVLADKSGSMSRAIDIARHVSAALAKFVKGQVHLVFFDTAPRAMDVTGKTLDEIKKMTQHVSANGGTSIGCGLQWVLQNKYEVDGIAIVSDGEENTPPLFADVYKRYSQTFGKEVPVYLYLCDGGSNASLVRSMQSNGIDLQVFDVNRLTDYYSLPNMVTTMRTNRYSLLDEVMATKLLKLENVFKFERKEEAVSA